MLTAILRRTLLSILVLFMVAVFVFLATEVLPGDALDVYLSEDDVSARIGDAYGDALTRRLAEIKARHDPDNLFRVNQNIVPAPALVSS